MILLESVQSKIAKYCSYQERSQVEVADKLKRLGCSEEEVPHYIVWLLEENYLSEERFARAYVRGKFNLKKWGKQKIIRSLKQHDISSYLQKAALDEISDEAYYTTAYKLIETKMKLLCVSKLDYPTEQKVFAYMYRKGYEANIIKNITSEFR